MPILIADTHGVWCGSKYYTTTKEILGLCIEYTEKAVRLRNEIHGVDPCDEVARQKSRQSEICLRYAEEVACIIRNREVRVRGWVELYPVTFNPKVVLRVNPIPLFLPIWVDVCIEATQRCRTDLSNRYGLNILLRHKAAMFRIALQNSDDQLLSII